MRPARNPCRRRGTSPAVGHHATDGHAHGKLIITSVAAALSHGRDGGVVNAAGGAPRLVLRLRERDELLHVPRHRVKASPRPLLRGLLDPLRPGGHEVPPDVAGPSIGAPPKKRKLGRARCSHADRIAGSQHPAVGRRPEMIAVLTDVDMPGSLNGFEFAQLVKQGWPELAVLVISGKMEPGPGDLPRGVAFVQKSIRPAALVEHIRALLPAS